MASGKRTSFNVLIHTHLVLVFLVTYAFGQCPWQRNATDLHSACICSYVASKLSLQCTAVDFNKLIATLRDPGVGVSAIDLFYIKNSSIPTLNNNTFEGLRISGIHFTRCSLVNISDDAFDSLEDTLKSLSLPENNIVDVPSKALQKLRLLTTLDLSNNKLRRIPNATFEDLKLDTLNLMGNNITIDVDAFVGLERSLKNLNLKNTGITVLPEALKRLRGLAFLDLAQNSIRNITSGYFSGLSSLTALSLERNHLQELDSDAFVGLTGTLSSLSLLNNLFNEAPTSAFSALTELRVLDLGFNQIKELHENAFQKLTSLTLLAMDGNPLTTLPFGAFKHFNKTLRGLSVGGKSLLCDCKIRWIAEWVREYDLQVTSRERNPQFCGQPRSMRSRNLYQIRPSELICEETTTAPPTTTTSISTSTTSVTVPLLTSTPVNNVPPPEILEDSQLTTAAQTLTTTISTWKLASTPAHPDSIRGTPRRTVPTSSLEDEGVSDDEIKSISSQQKPEPSLRQGRTEFDSEIRVTKAYRQDSTVVIAWDAFTSNLLGFRVIYRPFGEDTFKLGPPLSNRKREFLIRSVPSQEYLVVCVVNLELYNITMENVPINNCREVRGISVQTAGHTEIDKIVIIAASASICIAVIIIVIIFVCCHRRSKVKHTTVVAAPLPPIVSIPVVETMKPDWDNVSAYSTRSIPRARMYHMTRPGGTINSGYMHDDARSHISHVSSKHVGGRPPSVTDGQSHNPYSSPPGHAYLMTNGHTGGSLINPYPLGRPELNRSSKSLAQFSYPNPKRTRPQGSKSTAGSVHSLSGYETEGYFHSQPHWSDNEVDIFATGDRKTRAFGKRDFT